jgi:hypothetical protein
MNAASLQSRSLQHPWTSLRGAHQLSFAPVGILLILRGTIASPYAALRACSWEGNLSRKMFFVLSVFTQAEILVGLLSGIVCFARPICLLWNLPAVAPTGILRR